MLGLGLSIPNGRRTGGGVQGPIVVVPVGGLLLDLYPGAAAAYSLRQLSASFTGPVVRVRRSSDNTESDIGLVDGMLNEAALLAFVGTGDAFVTTWYDQSGNARNATQATAANQPRIVLGGVVDKVNGRPAASFITASNTRLLTTAFDTPQPWTVFAAVNPAASTRIVEGGTDFFNIESNPAGRAVLYADNPALVGNVFNGSLQRVTAIANGANSVISISGSVDVTGATGATTDTGPKGIGGRRNLFLQGPMPEFIVYLSNQSANRAAIEADIINFYSIT